MGVIDLETPGMESKRRGSKPLTRLRNCLLFRPLALILALQFVPPEAGNWSLVTPAHAQSAAAVIVNLPATCFQNGGTFIIQLICNDGTFGMSNNQIQTMVQQFETDSIIQFLAFYQLSNTASDVQFVYQYGRTDLRCQIRAYMEVRLGNILYEQANSITPTQNEQQFATWFTHMVWRHEKNMWQAAVNDFKSWQANRCTWQIDQSIAKQFNIHYIPCVGSVVADTAPTYNYFYLANRTREYDQLLVNLSGPAYLAPTAGAGATPASYRAASAKPRTTPPASPFAGNALSLAGITETDFIALVGAGLAVAALTAVLASLANSTVAISTTTTAKTPIEDGDFIEYKNETEGEYDFIEYASEQLAKSEALDTNATDAADLGADSVSLDVTAEDVGVDGSLLLAETDAGLEAASDLSETVIGAVIAIAVTMVVVAVTFLVQEAEAQTVELNQLTGINASVQSAPVELWPKLVDANGEGQYKIQTVWIEATYPDVPSTATLPAPDGTQETLIVNAYNSTTFTNATYNTLTYQDWGGNTRTAVLYKNWWETSGTVTAGSTQVPFNSITPSIKYLDNNNKRMTVSRFGNKFIVAKDGWAPTDKPCPAGPNTDGSTDPNSANCIAYVTSQFSAANGPTSLTVSVGTAPAFQMTSPTFLNTQPGQSAAVTATGAPTPGLSLAGGVILPAGMGFIPGAPGQFVCCQYPTAPPTPIPSGTYSFNVTAHSVAGNVTQPISVDVIDDTNPVAIKLVSAPSADATAGMPMTWIYKATGTGNIAFSTFVNLPGGVTFTDNGNGTATFTGTPTGLNSTDPCGVHGCYLFASNDGSTYHTDFSGSHPTWDAILLFGLTNNSGPLSPITSPPAGQLNVSNTLYFPDGRSTTVNVAATGATTPVTFSAACGGLPSWATFTDNGNGTGAFTGTPPRGANDIHAIRIAVNTLGLAPDTTPCNITNANIGASQDPQILSGSTAVFAVGSRGSFTVVSSLSNGTFVPTSPLPSGLTLVSNGDGTATISGTPPTGSGRDYKFEYSLVGTITIPNPLGGGTPIPITYTAPSLIIQVTEAATLNVPPTIYFMAGAPNIYPLVTPGYPAFEATQIQLASSLPTGLSFVNVSPLTTAPGSGTLTGTPPVALGGATVPLVFQVTNPGPVNAALGLPPLSYFVTGNLLIVKAGDVTHDGNVDCNDVAAVKAALNATRGMPNYNYYADINGDGVVNVLDLAFVSSHLAAGTACH
jgi:Dockerin type I domain